MNHPFSNGGWVTHGIRLHGSDCRFSAWFDEHGNLQDAERIDRRRRAYPVKSPIQLASLRTLGHRAKVQA